MSLGSRYLSQLVAISLPVRKWNSSYKAPKIHDKYVTGFSCRDWEWSSIQYSVSMNRGKVTRSKLMNKTAFPVGNSSHVGRTIFETCDVPIVDIVQRAWPRFVFRTSMSRTQTYITRSKWTSNDIHVFVNVAPIWRSWKSRKIKLRSTEYSYSKHHSWNFNHFQNFFFEKIDRLVCYQNCFIYIYLCILNFFRMDIKK